MKRFTRNGGQFLSYFAENSYSYDKFKKLSDQITCEIEKTLDSLDLDGIFFKSFKRSSGVKGNADLRNLLWWNIEINNSFLDDKFCGYENILLTTYRVMMDDVSKVSIGNGNLYPHIDEGTGNIHIEFDLFQWLENNTSCPENAIQQAVLAGPNKPGGSDPGPRCDVYTKKMENLVMKN